MNATHDDADRRILPWITPPQVGTAWPDKGSVLQSLRDLIETSRDQRDYLACIYLGHAVWLLEHEEPSRG